MKNFIKISWVGEKSEGIFVTCYLGDAVFIFTFFDWHFVNGVVRRVTGKNFFCCPSFPGPFFVVTFAEDKLLAVNFKSSFDFMVETVYGFSCFRIYGFNFKVCPVLAVFIEEQPEEGIL